MSQQGVRYSVEDGIASLALNRPDQSNSIDLDTARALSDAVDRARLDDDARVVMVTGEGTRFCAGGDVASMAEAEDPAGYLLDAASALDGALRKLSALEKPVLAGVQGAAAGAGLAVALSADLVVSAASSKFLAAYADVGLTPDCGLSWMLPRAVGQQRALDLVLTGRVLSADEALDWGLVTRVVPDEQLTEQVRATAAALAEAPPFALGQARRLLRQSWATTRAETGADEARTISRAVQTAEARRLIARFLGK